MGIVKCQTVVNIMEEIASRKLAESWDNVGLLVGDGKQQVKKIMVCLDLPEWVVDEAVSKEVDMIISHHPIIFSGIKRVNTDSVLGRKLIKLIKNNISVYCSHTNYDIVEGGLNDIFCSRLGFAKTEVIETTAVEKVFKIAVFVPKGYEDNVMQAMGNAGAGFIGNYSHCTFSASGTGTFKPLQGANPFIGKQGKLESVEEFKIETVTTEKNLNKVIKEMLKEHPYEEVAYDVFELENKGVCMGIGRLAILESEISLYELAEKVKQSLGIENIKIAGKEDRKVKKVALLNGAGNKFVNAAYYKGADVLITGDMQYHETLDALELGMCIIDAGHYATERIMIEELSGYLKKRFIDLKYNIEVVESSENMDPVKVF